MRNVFLFVLALALGAVAFAVLRPFGDGPARVGAVFTGAVFLWVTEALPLAATALLSTTMLVLVAGIDDKKAFGAYGNPIIPLFIGSFILARAMELRQLSDRVAYVLLSRRWASRSASLLTLSLGLVACAISLLVSNTATTAMMLPIGLAVLATMKADAVRERWAVGMLLMLTWGSSVAVGFPIGTPPNLIGLAALQKEAGVHISFPQWMTFGMPVTAIMLAVAWLIARVRYGKGPSNLEGVRETAEKGLRELGPWTPSQKTVVLAFGVSMALWMLPDLAKLALGERHQLAIWLGKSMKEAVAALVGASLLFLLPTKDTPSGHAISWREAATINWGTILLFGGGIALGDAMFDSGLATKLGQALTTATGVSDVWQITFWLIVASVLLSELASNTAAATALVPMAIGIAKGAGVNPVAPALGVALGASIGFMLPVSTPPNAIVYSSGMVPMKEMALSGVVLDVVSVGVIWGCLRLLLPVLGLA